MYPELEAGFDRIAQIAYAEEEAFRRTLAAGTTILDTAVARTKGGGGTTHGLAGHTMAFLVDQVPVADFEADVQTGVVPTTVVFTDLSSGVPTSWLWDFGDGSTSTSQNPSHTYTVAGGVNACCRSRKSISLFSR